MGFIEVFFLLSISFLAGCVFGKSITEDKIVEEQFKRLEISENNKESDDSGEWYAGRCTCLNCLSTYMLVCPASLALENMPMECSHCGKESNFIFHFDGE